MLRETGLTLLNPGFIVMHFSRGTQLSRRPLPAMIISPAKGKSKRGTRYDRDPADWIYMV